MHMNKPTIITTPSGDRLAILPLADYEMLVAAAEDAEDVRIVEEFKRKMAAGEEELVPDAYMERFLAGENPVRVWRDLRGMSAKELAAKAGISASYLSQIENGERDGTFGTMKKIATALGVDLDDLAGRETDQ
jgi:ribosome-binding protein aMBF1 (putative translation factor)